MTQAKTILIVDDDTMLASLLAEQLSVYDDFQVETLHSAGEMLRQLKTKRPDLVLLDVSLPDMDGREACRMLRDNRFKSPIIMMTADATTDADTILGFGYGASDYVLKPVKFAVLLARVRAHLRSHEHTEDAVFRIGPYEFVPSQKVLTGPREKRIRLTDKETNILKYLFRAGAKSVARDELLREVWGYNSNVTTHTLETHIYRLRQKIEHDPANAKLLITETGGYRLSP